MKCVDQAQEGNLLVLPDELCGNFISEIAAEGPAGKTVGAMRLYQTDRAYGPSRHRLQRSQGGTIDGITCQAKDGHALVKLMCQLRAIDHLAGGFMDQKDRKVRSFRTQRHDVGR